MKIEISKIIIGQRIRDDLGDIAGLAENIEDIGLLHPIILRKNNDDTYKLLAGHRRLESHKLLKRTSIESKIKTHE